MPRDEQATYFDALHPDPVLDPGLGETAGGVTSPTSGRTSWSRWTTGARPALAASWSRTATRIVDQQEICNGNRVVVAHGVRPRSARRLALHAAFRRKRTRRGPATAPSGPAVILTGRDPAEDTPFIEGERAERNLGPSAGAPDFRDPRRGWRPSAGPDLVLWERHGAAPAGLATRTRGPARGLAGIARRREAGRAVGAVPAHCFPGIDVDAHPGPGAGPSSPGGARRLRPGHVRCCTTSASLETATVDWITPVLGDACRRGGRARLRRDSPAATTWCSPTRSSSTSAVTAPGAGSPSRSIRSPPLHWVQTPYRYFPIEPHWIAPGMQFLPGRPAHDDGAALAAGAQPGRTREEAMKRVLWTELVDRTQICGTTSPTRRCAPSAWRASPSR